MNDIDFADSAPGLGALSRKMKRMTMAGVLLAMFLSSIDHTIIATAMPRIIADLGAFGQYTLISSIYIVASAIVMPITGRLTDLYGRKPFYIAGLVIFIGASVGCGFSRTLLQMVIWRAVKGIGGGIMMATGFTVIGDLYPPAQRGRYVGIGSAVFGLAAIIGPILGGFITDHFSWPWVFFINIPLGVVVIILFLRYFPHLRPDLESRRIDVAGILILTLLVLAFMLAAAWGGSKYPWPSYQIAGIAAFAAMLLPLFIWVESRSPSPIIPLELFNNSVVVLSLTAIFLSGFSMYGSLIFVPLFFQGVLGATATASGSILTPMMLGIIAGSSISGHLLNRTGGHYKIQGGVGLLAMALGVGLLARMDAGSGTTMALINVTLTGFGLGITLPLYTIAVQNAVPYRLLGVATSSAPFFRSLGGACGLALLGAVMHRRFSVELTRFLAAPSMTRITPDKILQVANNPQVLVDAERQRELETALTHLVPEGARADLFALLIDGMRSCLEGALSCTFWAAFVVVLISFLVHLWIKEIPLRSKHS